MRFIFLTVLSFLLGCVLANPLVVHPGGAKQVKIDAADTLNATHIKVKAHNTTSHHHTDYMLDEVHVDLAAATEATPGFLALSLYNNLNSNNVNVYITGLDSNGILVMLLPNGSWFYPTSTPSTTPQEITENVAIPLGDLGTTTTITLPGYLSSGRVWFADGNLVFYTLEGPSGGPELVEPSAVNPDDASAAVNWGFVELTYAEDSIYVNISYVDFVGLPIGMALYGLDGTVQTALGVDAGAVDKICAGLVGQAAIDGQPWDELCVFTTSGDVIRVLSPTDYLSIAGHGWSGYWTTYIDDVWDYHSTMPLTIDTQSGYGHVNCTTNVVSETMSCDQDSHVYRKPSAMDIFGCSSGPFAIDSDDNGVHQTVVPRLCAAFHRSTFLLPGGQVQPGLDSTYFYGGTPTNWYSKLVHDNEADGKGYAFAYDDVTPDDGTNQSGLLANTDPILLALTVGGPVTTRSSATTATSTTAPSTTTSSTTTSSTLIKASSMRTTSSLSSTTSTPSRITSSTSTTSTQANSSSVTLSLHSTLLRPIFTTISHS